MNHESRQVERAVHRRELPTEASSILLVGLDGTSSIEVFEESDLTHVASGRGALELMRVMRFDLLMLSSALPDMSTWELIAAIRSLWPWQRWALVGAITEQQEIRARTLGATGVFGELPGRAVLLEIANPRRRHVLSSRAHYSSQQDKHSIGL